MKVFAVPVDFNTPFPRELFDIISPERRNRLSEFRRKEDKIRGLLSELLVRLVLDLYYGIHNHQIHIIINSFGKPFLKNLPLHFNVSHSGKWIVAAVDDQSVGIDIEKIEPIDYQKISRFFFSNEEYTFIMDQQKQDQLMSFYSIWTGKESYLKATGQGLSVSLNSFSVCNDSGKIISNVSPGNEEWHLQSYNISPEYHLTVCSPSAVFPDKPVIFTLEEVIGHFVCKS